MANLESFNKQNIKQIRNEVEAALEKIGAKHGIKFSLGNISFDNAKFTAKGFNGRIMGASSMNDIITSQRLGFKDSAYGKSFIHEGETFTIVGLKPHNKRQIVAEGNGGARYVFPKNMVFSANPSLKA